RHAWVISKVAGFPLRVINRVIRGRQGAHQSPREDSRDPARAGAFHITRSGGVLVGEPTRLTARQGRRLGRKLSGPEGRLFAICAWTIGLSICRSLECWGPSLQSTSVLRSTWIATHG